MLNALWWLLTIEAIGLAAFPIAYQLCRRFGDRGYSLSKPLGMLILGYLSWILSVLQIVPSVRMSIAVILLIVGMVAACYGWNRRNELKVFIKKRWKTILLVEAVFLIFFVGWAIFQAHDPAINHTEQPMDFAFLNSSIESTVGTPRDVWLAGESVQYYYFGYWIMGSVSELTGIPSTIAYNLSLASIPALGAAAIFGLVLNLLWSDRARFRYAILAGLSAAVLLCLTANLEGVLEFMRTTGMGSMGFWEWLRIDGLDGTNAKGGSWLPQEFWWWFRATRIINTFHNDVGVDYTIQEFPLFSFVLGDLHPHVMSIPFVLLFVSFCWSYVKSPEGVKGNAVLILAMALALGGLAFINMWDLPVFAALFLGTCALRTYRSNATQTWGNISSEIVAMVTVCGLAVILYLPYYLSFNSSINGIAPVISPTTRPIHFLVVWALFLVGVVPFIVTSFLRTVVGEDWLRLVVVSWGATFLPYLVWALTYLLLGGTADLLLSRFFHYLPMGLLLGAAVYTILWQTKRGGMNSTVFALILAVLGLLIIVAPEFFFLRDLFNNRMNTIFKLYYQAWILLSVAAGFGIYYWITLRRFLKSWQRFLSTVWGFVFVALLVGSLYYSVTAPATKIIESTGHSTLDGLDFVLHSHPAEYEAIQFLKSLNNSDAIIVEAVGEWGDAGLISRSTGIPTVINWPGHEHQWRGSMEKLEGREEDVTTIYQTLDTTEAVRLLAKYDVDYVYIGPREAETYGSQGLPKFDKFLTIVFIRDDVKVYSVTK